MLITPIVTRVFRDSESVSSFVQEHMPVLADGSVLAITSKIVAVAEGRVKQKGEVKSKEDLIRGESERVARSNVAWITLKDGMVMANAGIDESNADGRYILLPSDSFVSSQRIREQLLSFYGISNLGVLITDSKTPPFRKGSMGMALGYAGFKGLRDYRRQCDIFGRPFRNSQANIADALAAAAVVTMGEGDEHCPLAVITDAPVEFSVDTKRNELCVAPENDMYSAFFTAKSN